MDPDIVIRTCTEISGDWLPITTHPPSRRKESLQSPTNTMTRFTRLLLIATCLLMTSFLTRAHAGTLVKAEIERMIDYFYTVGEIQPDLPVSPLFVKDPASPDKIGRAHV